MKYLNRYQSDPDFLDRLIAIDETWIKSYDPRDTELNNSAYLDSSRKIFQLKFL
jgi:hypothetical protein